MKMRSCALPVPAQWYSHQIINELGKSDPQWYDPKNYRELIITAFSVFGRKSGVVVFSHKDLDFLAMSMCLRNERIRDTHYGRWRPQIACTTDC